MDKLNLWQKLLKIQKHCMGLAKDKENYNYNYTSGEKVLRNIKPLMNELGLLLKQEAVSIQNVRMDYTTSKGQEKTEILSTIHFKFTWIDTDSNEREECLFVANGQNDFDKGVGSANTYAERYFLLKFFHIATDEDDIDNPNRKPEEPQAPPLPLLSEKLFKKAQERILAGEQGLIDKLLKLYTIPQDKLEILKAL